MDLMLIGLILLVLLAFSDLIVGVSNDAVNFLNSSVGSRVATRRTIMIIASGGILVGVTFAGGMMDVAKKGIFHPQFFTLPEIMTIFLAVMLTDIYLLDLFNTFGLPTSTTVSIVFELVGASVAVSLIKILRVNGSLGGLSTYLNTGKILMIIAGILLSVAISFVVGSVVQLFTRLLFTFDFSRRLKRYGAVWGGAALSSIVYFILIKGAKGASFMSPENLQWIKTHTSAIFLASFLLAALILQLLSWIFHVNILKVVILVGTFALALAFAANDLVNFIGVPLAGLGAFQAAGKMENPLSDLVSAQLGPPQYLTQMLLLAGMVMVVTLWVSKKARSVMKTEISLGRQGEGAEQFASSTLSRAIVRMGSSLIDGLGRMIPHGLKSRMNARLDPSQSKVTTAEGDGPSFDLLRAAVNLMVASALISMGTALKLPLSTTYVTFMVAMATSFADRAWDRDSAVYRVSGVLTVIGGWFFTAIMAFTVSGLFALAIYYGRAWAVLGLLGLVGVLIYHNNRVHRRKEAHTEVFEVFNLKKIKDAPGAARTTFLHAGLFLEKVAFDVGDGFDALFQEDRRRLRQLRRHTRELQNWSQIIVANVFKVLRMKRRGDIRKTRDYYNTIEALQEIAEAERDLIMRAYTHVSNNHKGLLAVQKDELKEIRDIMVGTLEQSARSLREGSCDDLQALRQRMNTLENLLGRLDEVQIARIQNNSSKTRLSILFYGLLRDAEKLVGATLNLMEIFGETLSSDGLRDGT